MTAAADPQAQLFAAFSKAQAEFPPITRGRDVEVQTKSGGKYTFAYATLAAILADVKPVLSQHGLAVTQLLTAADDGRPAIRTMLVHEGGGFIDGCLPIKTDGMNPQEVGSLVTYCRRYALVSLLGIAPEDDDDANKATGNQARGSTRTNGIKKATAAQAKEIEDLIAELNDANLLGEIEVREGMTSAYGTQDSKALTDPQARDLIKRLKAKKTAVAA